MNIHKQKTVIKKRRKNHLKKLLGTILIITIFGSVFGLVWWDISHKLPHIEVEHYDKYDEAHCTYEHQHPQQSGHVCDNGHNYTSDRGIISHEMVHYLIHILVCLFFCVVVHQPAHKFWNWVKSLLGITNMKDPDCKACCKH